MAYCSSTTGELSQRGPSCDSQHHDPRSDTRKSIHIIDNDSLLNIFHFCRPAAPSFSFENEADAIEILGGGNWNSERWWYSLVKVCHRWRCLVLESASLLGLSLLCTHGTPVADMLEHSPPLPLILDYRDLYDYITADDETGIISALRHRDRVRCISIMQPVPALETLILFLNGEFPNLEYLFIERHPYCGPQARPITEFPRTFHAPRLRYLVMMGFEIVIEPPLFTTIGNRVALSLTSRLVDIHPNVLLQQLSVMPRRETPGNTFNPYLPIDDADRQSLQRAIMRRVTPYLHRFGFQGANAYLETLLPRVAIRLLERLHLYFFDQLTYLIPRYQQFMSPVEIPQFECVTLMFLKDHSSVYAHGHGGNYKLRIYFGSRHLNRQVARTAQVSHMLRRVFSVVERLILQYDSRSISSEWNNEADRTQWRELLRAFDNTKTLYIGYGLVEQLSRSLQPGKGEPPVEPLPNLQKLSYPALESLDDPFAQFIDARRKAGHLIHQEDDTSLGVTWP